MPEKVTAWSCSFKCGERVKTKRIAMVGHESRCFHNPQRRACQSCGRFDREALTETPDLFPTCEKVDSDDMPRFDCEFWKQKS